MSDLPHLLGDRYRLVSVLGRGGMGQVWLGEDELLGRQVAVKEIRFPHDMAWEDREVARERTMREARLTARLNHPGIVTVFDVVSEDGRPFIVMELVRAESLAQLIDREGPLAPARVAWIGRCLLDALDVAHAEGVVHRDVKPSNVLLDGDRVVLSDFGIATSSTDSTLTTTGLVVGSPSYMSPERLRSEGIGPTGDMWSLGATLYAALEGHPPFRAGNVMGTITTVLADPPEPPAVTGPLREAVLGLLVKSPDDRLDSAGVRPLLEAAEARLTGTSEEEGPAASTDDLPVMAPVGGGWHDTPAPEPAASESPAPPASPPATPPAAQPAAPPGPPPGPPPSSAPTPTASASVDPAGGRVPLRRRTAVLIVLVVAVLVAVVVVLITLLRDDGTDPLAGSDNDSSQGTDGGTGTEPAEDGNGAEPEVPDGYRLVHDDLDFTVAVPDGWERSLDGPTRVDFVSPDGTQFLRVDQRAQAGPSAEQAWLASEPGVADSLSGYSRIRIEPVDYRWQAADWEFTWEGDSGTIHVLNRGFITDPRGFALYMSGPDDTWQEESLPVFEVAAETFEPSR